MRNIWYKKTDTGFAKKAAISVLLLAAAVTVTISGTNMALEANEEQQTEQVEEGIRKAVRLCYAIEGAYPPSINYLEENYGVNVDRDKYIIHYEIFAQNIMPDIKVYVNK